MKGETVILGDLPSETALQFLFLRGGERHGTSAAARLPQGRRSLGSVTLPPVPTAQAAARTTSASVSVSTAPEEEGPVPLAGVVWGHRPR